MRRRTQSEIAQEIDQILNQYRTEVPSRRTSWPKAIKDRVRELRELKITDAKISKLTGISVQTIYTWKRADRNLSVIPVPPNFLTVEIKPSTVTVVGLEVEKPKQTRTSEEKAVTVTVIAPSGLRVEGMPVELAMKLLEAR